MDSHYILTLSCPDGYGIVSNLTTALTGQGAFILQSDQFSDTTSNTFFMRILFSCSQKPDLSLVAKQYKMNWHIHRQDEHPRTLLLVSKADHCLATLLHEWKTGRLPIAIEAVASNHEDLKEIVGWYKLPFYHFPVSKENREEQEQQILCLVASLEIDLVVLARYMQILSPMLVQNLQGKAVNIHHSFLPSFKGAKPYHQAFDRGVKMIGATAHFVTDDLDEGPIIEQNVCRVDHRQTPKELVALGRSVESRTLKRAIELIAQRRVLLNKTKTVVF